MAHEKNVLERSKAKMEASNYNANGVFAKELEEELMKFTTISEDDKVDENLTIEAHKNDDMEVNITECTKSVPLGKQMVEADYHDTTENSSSFDNSDCGFENLDDDAISDFRGDFDGFGEMFRKKKPTAHWRSFIQPIMWRCKWVELQILKLQRQAQKYDKELEAYDKSNNSTLEGECSRSLPFTPVNAKNDVLRRKKRKRVEVTTDVAAYMSRHKLFSYYENRKSFAEGGLMYNGLKNAATLKVNINDDFWTNEDPFFDEPGNDDKSLENVFRKIEFLQSQVGKLKGRVDVVISENAGKFSFSDDISLLMPPSHNYPPNNWDIMPATNHIASQLISEFNNNDVFVPESAITTHGDGRDVNGSTSHARFAHAYENVEDGALIDNQRVKEEMNTFSGVKIHQIQRPLVIKDEPDNLSPPIIPQPDMPTDEQPAPKMRSVSSITPPNNKRKRGRRRGSGRWSKRARG